MAVSVVIWLAVIVVGLLWLKEYLSKSGKMNIPGPRGRPVIGVANMIGPVSRLHIKMTEWAKKYGPVMYVKIMLMPIVVVSDYATIYEVTVKKGLQFGGRPNHWRSVYANQGVGILSGYEPDAKWKSLRKSAQRHFRQFGDGLSRLENIIQEIAEDMFSVFDDNVGNNMDPGQVIFDTALNSITFLVTGKRTHAGDTLVTNMCQYEDRVIKYISPLAKMKYIILDFLPWLRYLGLQSFKDVQSVVDLENVIWQEIKTLNRGCPTSQSLSKLLLAEAESGGKDPQIQITETHAKKTSTNLLIAGVTTTSNTFYGAINILAHHPHIQEAIWKEIKLIKFTGRAVNLSDRSSMHYTRAFIFELLRYTSVVPLGVQHRVRENTTVGGYEVPKGMRIQVNIWGLHHDPEFWDDPEKFKPKRFLDASGEVVPADHPNRRHLMPFGAGLRVCLGESLALTRLFIWITSLVSRFNVKPSKGNDFSTTDARMFTFVTVLRPTPYKVIFNKR